MGRKKNLGKLKILIIVLFLFFTFLFLANKFSVYKPSSISFVQYTGYLNKNWFDDKIGTSKEVEIGDYKFVTQTFDQYWINRGCQENTCGGEFDHIDEWGCEVYKKTYPSGTYCCYHDTGGGTPWVWYCEYNGRKYSPERGKCSFITSGNVVNNVYEYGAVEAVYKSSWSSYCGGAKILKCVNEQGYVLWGCSYTVDIYKNNNLIKTIGYNIGCGSNVTGSSVYDDDEVHASFGVSKWFEYHSCRAIMNQYTLKIPSDKIIFNITPSKEFYYTGENATLDFIVTNNWRNGLYAKSYLEMCVPTIFGDKCKTFTKEFDLPLGTKTSTFDIPTRQVTDKIILKPSIEIFLDTNSYNLKGLNIDPHKVRNSNGITCSEYYNGRTTVTSIDLCRNAGYNLISLGKVSGNQSEVQIVPQVINFCETDSDCLSPCEGVIGICRNPDGKGKRCFYSGECNPIIVQCVVDSDCPKSPCEGAKFVCSNNRCVIVGECIMPVQPSIWDKIIAFFKAILSWITGLFGW